MSRFDDEMWAQRDGTPIRVGDMTPRHAFNAWKMMMRGARLRKLGDNASWRMAMGPQPSGDMACDAFELELIALMEHPVLYGYEHDTVKALWLRSLDEWVLPVGPDGWPQPRYEGVPLWKKFASPYMTTVATETRWAACTAIAPRKWREVCIGELDAVVAYVRDGASRGAHYKTVRLEYVDPTTGVYTEDDWERKERERLLRRSEDPRLDMRLRHNHIMSPSEEAEWEAGREERDRDLAEELHEETEMADEADRALAEVMEDHYRYGSGGDEWHPQR